MARATAAKPPKTSVLRRSGTNIVCALPPNFLSEA
jgi:hypothetical protein